VTGDYVELIGRSPRESHIVGIDRGVMVRGPGWLTLRRLGISGSNTGVDVEGPGRTVSIQECEIFDNNYGITFERLLGHTSRGQLVRIPG
jgi:hypothetical protein